MILGTITPTVFGFQGVTGNTAVNLTTIANTTIINFSGGPGIINMLSVVVTVGLSANAVTAQWSVTIDGAAAILIPIYTSGILWDLHGMGACVFLINPGGVANNMMNMLINTRFQNSLIVQLQVTATTLTTGQVSVLANWSHN